MVLRARIVLLAAEGTQDLKIARLLSIVPRTAARWRSRFLRDGIAGLEHDALRPGRTPSISPELVRMVIAKTTQERPSHATHWSTRTMAALHRPGRLDLPAEGRAERVRITDDQHRRKH